MPRKPRLWIDYPGGVYHIINRGVNRQTVFMQEEDYSYFLSCLQITQQKYPFKLFSFCLMPNHFHLLIWRIENSTSRILSSLLTRFSIYINKKYKRFGHLFQGRSKTILCERDPYLLELARYIPLNPVRSNLVAAAEDWPWSSYRLFLGRKIPKVNLLPIVELKELLNHFGEEPHKAFRRFKAFLKEGLEMGHRKDLYPKSFIPILGSKTFIRRVLEEQKIEPQRKILFPGQVRVPLEKLVQCVCLESGVSVERLRHNTKEREVSRVRAKIAYLASRHANIALSKLSAYFGVGISALSMAASKFYESVKKDTGIFEGTLKGLKEYNL